MEKLLENSSIDLPEVQDGSEENLLVLFWKLALRLACLRLDFKPCNGCMMMVVIKMTMRLWNQCGLCVCGEAPGGRAGVPKAAVGKSQHF